MTRQIIWAFICFTLISNSARAQFILQGTVLLEEKASEENEAKINSSIEIYHHESNTTKYANDAGDFMFEITNPGQHTFTLFSIGYETLTDTINIIDNITHTFQLKNWNMDLGAIDIIAQKEELFAIKQLQDVEGASIFAGKKTEVIIMDLVKGNVANNNGRQVYAQVSGLNIYEGSNGGLQLNIGGRGLDPSRTTNFNTRQNGYDISADVLGYPENYYTPPSEAISEIRIIRGASSLQYGTQFGGLIDFRLRKIPSYKKLDIITNQTIGSNNAINSFNYIGMHKGRLSINAFYNYKKGDGNRSNSNYKAHNGFLSLDYSFNKQTQIGLELTYFNSLAKQAGGLTDTQFDSDPMQSTRARNWFSVNWKLYSLKLKHQFSPASLLTINLFGLDASRLSVGYRGDPVNLNENPITSLDEQDVDGQYIKPRDLIDGRFKNYGAEVRFLNNYKIKDKKSVLLLGAKYYKSDNSSTQGPGSLDTDADFDFYTEQFSDYSSQSSFSFPNLNVSLFAENIIYLSEKIALIPGIRLEHIKTESAGNYNQVVYDNAGNALANTMIEENKELERQFALMGLGFSYKKSKQLQLVANLSQNYRSVTFSDIRVVSPTFIVDPDIRDEKGYTADIGLKGRLGKVLSYDFTLYSVLYNDRIGIIIDSRANRRRKNIGKAIIAGTEALVNVNFARWLSPRERNYNLNAFANVAFTRSQYLESEESNVVGKQVEFVPAINLKSGLSMGYKNIYISYQVTYLSSQFTDVQNSEVAAEGDRRQGIIGPIPSYMISDLTFTYSLGQFKINAGINNLWNRSYFTRRATGYPGPGIIPSDPRSFFLSLGWRFTDN